MERHHEALASVVRPFKAGQEQECLDAVRAHCDGLQMADNGISTLLTNARKLLQAEDHPLEGSCRYPELTMRKNAVAAMKQAEKRLREPGYLYDIDIVKEFGEVGLAALRCFITDRAKLNSRVVDAGVATLFVALATGRRVGEIIDGRQGRPQYTWSEDGKDATLTYLLKQKPEHRAAHTFPLALFPSDLLQACLIKIRAHYLPTIIRREESGVPADRILHDIDMQINARLRAWFPLVTVSWNQYWDKQPGQNGFTVHCLRAFYCAHLYRLKKDEGLEPCYLKMIQTWLGHYSEDTSMNYEKVEDVVGAKLEKDPAAIPGFGQATTNKGRLMEYTSLILADTVLDEETKDRLYELVNKVLTKVKKTEKAASSASASSASKKRKAA